MFNKARLVQALLILTIALAVLEFTAPSIAAIDTTYLADWEVRLVQIVQYFYNYIPTALLGGFAWSLFGYLRYKFGDESIAYDITKFETTLMWFVGIMTPVCSALPTELGLAVTGIIMAVKSILNQLKETQATTPPPTK